MWGRLRSWRGGRLIRGIRMRIISRGMMRCCRGIRSWIRGMQSWPICSIRPLRSMPVSIRIGSWGMSRGMQAISTNI
jgi:hypothetical protein